MKDIKPQLTMHWFPVLGADGRTRMEASWYPSDLPLQQPAAAHAA